MTSIEEPVSPLPENNFESLLAARALTEDVERRRLRRSFTVACAVHAGLLAVVIPGLYTPEVVAETPPRKVFVVAQPIYKPPAPPPEKPIERKVRKPLPDPTPDDPEPLPVAEIEIDPEPPAIDDLVLDIPATPPALPPEPNLPVEVGGEVKAPVRVVYVEPQYTEPARRARIQGTVILETIVDRKGNVTQVKVLRPLGLGLTESAVAAVEQWKFNPGTLRGKPIDVIYRVTVRFQIS